VDRASLTLIGTLVAVALLTSSCGADETDSAGDEPPGDTAPVVEAPAATAPSTRPETTTPAPPLDEIDLDLEPVATVTAPVAMTTIPGTDELVWVAGKDGRLFEVDLSEGGEGRPVLDFSGDVSNGNEQGFLGVATAPDGEHLYTSYTDTDGGTRVDEYELDGAAIDEGSRRGVFAHPQPFNNHNGGNIVFGPDGMLYLGLGDGGSSGDPDGNGQDTTTLLASIMRIDPTAVGDRSYGVPSDNPFTDDDGRTEIWLYGVRNPWRFSFDPATGDLWIADVGQDDIEEIDLLPAGPDEPAGKGANLGWSLVEGTRDFAGTAPPDHLPPIFEYGRDGGNCSVTGGYVYRGEAIPDLDGTYLFADYCVSEVRGLRNDGGVIEETSFGIGSGPGTLGSFGQDATGELYLLDISGEISRIVEG
jgi:glucose/arabinose dehydrogenase